MKKLTLIADVLLISLSAGLFLPNSTINMAKYQSDNNKSLIILHQRKLWIIRYLMSFMM